MVLDRNPHFLLLADPAFRVESFVKLLDSAFPKGNKVGGMASGNKGGSSFILNNEIFRTAYGDPTSALGKPPFLFFSLSILLFFALFSFSLSFSIPASFCFSYPSSVPRSSLF